MPISGRLNLSPFDVLQTYLPSYAQDVPAEVGALGSTPDGRTFIMGFNNTASTALAPNKNTQGPAVIANMQSVTLSTQSIGDTSVTVTCSAQTLTANQMAGGYIGVISGTGSVATYRIKSHPAGTSATSYVMQLADPIYIATASSPVANIWANPYSAIIIAPTAVTGTMTGVPLVSITAQYYGWFQVEGTALMLNQGNTTVGLGLAISASVAGAMATVAATTTQIATASQAGTDGVYGFVDLNILG